jgi:hypothetical protein
MGLVWATSNATFLAVADALYAELVDQLVDLMECSSDAAEEREMQRMADLVQDYESARWSGLWHRQ